MRVFTFLLIWSWIVGLLIGCANAEFSRQRKNPDVTLPPTGSPPPTTLDDCERDNSCPGKQDFKFYQDTFTAPGGNTKVDILFVVDNSISMTTEQRRLGAGFNGFMNIMANFDYQIAFTTTDMSGNNPTQNGRLLPIKGGNSYLLKWRDANYNRHIDLFRATVQRSEIGSGDERGIYAAIKAFQRNEHGLIRSDADLALVIISDEDERSQGRSNLNNRLESGKDYPDDLIQVVRQIKGNSKSFTAHAIIIKDGDTECLKEQAEQGTDATPFYGKLYQQLAMSYKW